MATTTTLNLASTLALASYSSNYAFAQAGDGVVVAAYPWIGQYRSSQFELSQVMAAFDTTSVTGGFVSANLILTVDESYGTTVVEVRQHDWAANITAWVPGADLASKPLLGSVQVGPGGKRDITIPLSAFGLTAPLKVVLAIADQRNNITPTGDTTTLVTNARLAVTTAIITTTGAGTWTVPAGVTEVTVECWSGGQGGSADRGGRGGNYSRTTLSLIPGASVSSSIGSGGAGVLYASNVNGGDTWFVSATTCLAKGGGATSGSLGTGPRFYGGAGGGSFQGYAGGGGGAATPTQNGGNASTFNGNQSSANGGTSGATLGGVFGGNIVGGSNVEGGGGGAGLSGGAGGAPGGGGGGGSDQTSGGAGGRGQIRISWTASTAPTRRAPRSFYWL